MSFAQLYAAAATAAADTAYLEDVRQVQQLLQQLRRHAAAVRALQRYYGSQHRQQQQALYEEQQLQQHQQQLQQELEAARRAADGVRRALRLLQQHVSAATSLSEKQQRQLLHTQLVGASQQLLRQLRDAAEGEEWFLQQQQQLLLESSNQEQQREQEQQLQAARSTQSPFVTLSLLRAASDPRVVPQDEAPSTAGAAAAPAASAAAAPAASATARGSGAPIELVHAQQTAAWGWPPAGVCPGPLQMQHQLMRTNMSVPIFIPDSKIDASMLQEKKESLAKIHREIESIQSLYEQMAFFTEEQGEQLDAVDQRLIIAREEASRATREIATAVREERRRKCRRCIFGFSLLLILVLITCALWWNLAS